MGAFSVVGLIPRDNPRCRRSQFPIVPERKRRRRAPSFLREAVPYSRSSPTLLCPTDFGSNMASFAYILVFSLFAAEYAHAACADASQAVPLYRDWNPTVSDHFYTPNAAEAAAATGYTQEGPKALVFTTPVPGAVRLLRLYNAAPSDHFYTTNTTEAAGAVAGGYKLEDVNPIYVYPSALCGSVPLYRLFAGGVGDHFYTADAAERDGAEGSGWAYEWVAGYVFP
ncbi:hypothetical protein DFH08DRAFT_757787, partial [Mycena albidolilacea]